MFVMLSVIFWDSIFIGFGSKLYIKYRYSNGHKLCSYCCRFVLFRYESD